MAGLTWIQFTKTGITKEVSTKIANNKDYQNDKDRPFVIVGAQAVEQVAAPQKKIVAHIRSAAVSDNVGEQVETATLETPQETVITLHKQGKNEDEIKAETGLHKQTIRSLINKHTNNGN